MCVNYGSDIVFFKKLYHVAFTFLDKVYHFVPLIEGGFEVIDMEKFNELYPELIFKFNSFGNKIIYYNKEIILNDEIEIERRINFVKYNYDNKKIKYTAFGINCETVTLFILNSSFNYLNFNERLQHKDIFNFCGKNQTINSLIPFFKNIYNIIIEDNKDLEEYIFFMNFSNKKLSSYYDIDDKLTIKQNLEQMFLYLFQLYDF